MKKGTAFSLWGENLIFLISQPRAGSTLLQRILAGHPEIHATAEPWIMLHPLYALKHTGYTAEYNAGWARAALHDFCQNIEDGEESYVQAVRQMGSFLYNKAKVGTGKTYFLDKTPRYYFIIPELYRLFPKAKFIFLLRNPLAVLSSILTSWVKDDWDRIPQWKPDLMAAPHLLADGLASLQDRAVVVHYEELVTQPKQTVSVLCQALQIEYQPAILEYGHNPAPKGRTGDNIGIPKHTQIVSNYVNKWIEQLAQPKARYLAEIYLSFLGPELISQLGYDFDDLITRLLSVDLSGPSMEKSSMIKSLSLLDLQGVKRDSRFESDDVGGKANVCIEQSTSVVGTQPLVSAIVSTYKAERFIRGCLEDLEAQTIADRLEIVVVDTGSPQNEWSIVREFQQRYHNIVYIRTAQRESLYAAWNRGIQAARGTYITNANTDDRHKPDAFQQMVAILETRPEIALVYADAYVTTTENETFENHTLVGTMNCPDFDPLELLRRCYVGPQPMWRKRLHTRYGYFDESFEVTGDWEFWLRLAENETFLHLREFLGLYLSSPAGIENRNHALLSQENLRVSQRYGHRADQLTKEEGGDAAAAPAEPLLTATVPEKTAARRAAQHRDAPPVSCICLTYGRVALLEEAIESFLRQDYPGQKELIVLNDYDQQRLAFEHPEVRVINLPKRVRTVGEKRNMAVALASYDLLFGWDDDDICLPHRLSLSVERFEPAKGYFKAGSAWFWNNGQLSGPCYNAFHGISCWSRKLFDAVRGYGAAGSGEDLVFEQRLKRQFPGSIRASDIRPEEIYYIYRWGGTGSYHLSQFGDYRPGSNLGHHEAEAFVQQRAQQGELRQGRIPLQPHWKTDYRQLVSSYIATLGVNSMEEARSSKLSLARNRDEGNQSGQTTLKPILVTGAHRSGTTWVGRMLSLSSSVAYVHEPFNINNTHSAGGMGFRNWFTYIPDEDIDLCVRRMERIIKLEDPLGSELPNERRVALLKDPIALFSSEWLASQFDMNVIVLVRNPLAFAGSLKVQSWTYPFEHFLNQPKLMGEHLSPFADEIRRYAEEPPDIIDQACLLWNCIYSVVHSYREKHPDWIFLRHEDASWQPVSTFKVLYDRLGLRFTEEISTQVEAYTDPGKEEGVQQHRDVMRDSRSNIMSWQKRLTSSEIERVRARTASVAEFFYSGEDWSLSQQRLLR